VVQQGYAAVREMIAAIISLVRFGRRSLRTGVNAWREKPTASVASLFRTAAGSCAVHRGIAMLVENALRSPPMPVASNLVVVIFQPGETWTF